MCISVCTAHKENTSNILILVSNFSRVTGDLGRYTMLCVHCKTYYMQFGTLKHSHNFLGKRFRL